MLDQSWSSSSRKDWLVQPVPCPAAAWLQSAVAAPQPRRGNEAVAAAAGGSHGAGNAATAAESAQGAEMFKRG